MSKLCGLIAVLLLYFSLSCGHRFDTKRVVLIRKLRNWQQKRSEPHGTTCHSQTANLIGLSQNLPFNVQCDTPPPFQHPSTRSPHRPSAPRRPRATMAPCPAPCRPVRTRMRPASPTKPSRSSTRRSKRRKASTRPLPPWQRRIMGRLRRR